MGVKGLDSFIQQNKWGEEIDLKQFAQQHFETTGQVLTFAIDGGSFLHLLLQQSGPTTFLTGYSPSSFIKVFDSILLHFLQFKAKLAFFLDGCIPVNKELEVVKRLRRKRVMIEDYFSNLQISALHFEEVAKMAAKNEKQFDFIIEKAGKQVFYDEKLKEYNTITVPYMKHLFLELLREKQVQYASQIEIFRNLFEADNELAQFCTFSNCKNSNNNSEIIKENVIVIAQDSDYFIYDSVLKYVPMYSLQIQSQFSKGIIFEKEKLVQKMQDWFCKQGPFTLLRNFTPSLLADFSCLLGNDFFACSAIHDHLKSVISPQPFNQKVITKYLLVLWALLSFESVPISTKSVKNNKNSIEINCEEISTFINAVFPPRMIKAGRIEDFVKAYKEARQYYKVNDCNKKNEEEEEDFAKNQKAEQFEMYKVPSAMEVQFHKFAFPSELMTVLLRRFLSFEGIFELKKSSVSLYLGPLRRNIFAALFYKNFLLESCKQAKEIEVHLQSSVHLRSFVSIIETHANTTGLEPHVEFYSLNVPLFTQAQVEYYKRDLLINPFILKQLNSSAAIKSKKQINLPSVCQDKEFKCISREDLNEQVLLSKSENNEQVFEQVLKIALGHYEIGKELIEKVLKKIENFSSESSVIEGFVAVATLLLHQLVLTHENVPLGVATELVEKVSDSLCGKDVKQEISHMSKIEYGITIVSYYLLVLVHLSWIMELVCSKEEHLFKRVIKKMLTNLSTKNLF